MSPPPASHDEGRGDQHGRTSALASDTSTRSSVDGANQVGAATTTAPSPDKEDEKRTSDDLHVTPAADVKLESQKSRQDAAADLEVRLANPLKGYSRSDVVQRARDFAHAAGLDDLADVFAKGALLARDPLRFEDMPELDEADKEAVRRETTHRWQHPRQLYMLVICCSLGAVVQGMDQSVINGANLFFPTTFGIQNESSWLLGIINSAPYFSCALLACWVTEPLNHYFGRRGAIFISCAIALLTCVWAGLTHTWWHLLISRIFLGFGIAPKSATVPIYAAETVPAQIRGGLVMQWQLWTAGGIMLGFVADIAFYNVPNQSGIDGLNWRLMLGSAAIPPIFVLVLVYMSPESPRWYLGKRRFADAYKAMSRLRNTPLQAARDVYFAYEGMLAEEEANRNKSRSRLLELFTVPRIRKGTQSATFVMIMQQACSSIFKEAGATELTALGASLGWGAVNWIAGFPAIWTIDKLGRRGLLLIGFPLMAIFLFWAGFSFYITSDNARVAMVALGTYLHCISYSPTEGPVPFTYSSESFPLAHRTIGMTWAVSVCWFFNGVLSLTFPAMTETLTNTGAFCFYGAWNVFGFVYTYFLLPETKSLTLEELDAVFSVSNRRHAGYFAKKLPWYTDKYLFRRSVADFPPLYEHERLSAEERAARGTAVPAAAGH
ncbi:related to arabinose-proton symporter [Pseudozyma flocculosa]|uniref:Related to arabinose-proton symporter n=1 Tax=Pseudozyma flocculosa TaxID=84751 RepID=A0A5C3F465_9BASI|nr:related to arabinose-proton symporter [Pseudozyma flocculosa]